MAILGRINQKLRLSVVGFRKIFKQDEALTISRYLDLKLVQFLDVSTRDEALLSLVNLLSKEGRLLDKEKFFGAILDREKIVSTGIGLSVAIPHAKLEGYEDFFIAVGIQTKKGIDWNALDEVPVKLIFMIGGPSHKQTEYLQILSRLTTAVKNEERRKKIFKARNAQDILELFQGC